VGWFEKSSSDQFKTGFERTAFANVLTAFETC
jgi:hypothetical protein